MRWCIFDTMDAKLSLLKRIIFIKTRIYNQIFRSIKRASLESNILRKKVTIDEIYRYEWKEHLSVFLRDILSLSLSPWGVIRDIMNLWRKGKKNYGDRGNTRGIAFFPCEFRRNLTFMLPFFPPHLYKAAIAASRHWPFRRSFQCSPINGTRSTLRWHRFISLLGQDAQELFREGNTERKVLPYSMAPRHPQKNLGFLLFVPTFLYHRGMRFSYLRVYLSFTPNPF